MNVPTLVNDLYGVWVVMLCLVMGWFGWLGLRKRRRDLWWLHLAEIGLGLFGAIIWAGTIWSLYGPDHSMTPTLGRPFAIGILAIVVCKQIVAGQSDRHEHR